MSTEPRSNELFDENTEGAVPRIEPESGGSSESQFAEPQFTEPETAGPHHGRTQPPAVPDQSPLEEYEPEAQPTPQPPTDPRLFEKGQRSVAASTWAALIIGSLLLILLLVFVAQNTHNVDLHVAGYVFSFPLGVGILLAAVVGALIMALVGGLRMFELNRKLKKTRRALQQVESGH